MSGVSRPDFLEGRFPYPVDEAIAGVHQRWQASAQLGSMACDTEILVVGAGPTGLTVALQSRLLGAQVRIIEQRTEPRPWAPALAVQPRTMEMLRGLGVSDALLERSLAEAELRIHVDGWSVDGRLHHLHLPATEFPFILFAPQPEVETVLRDRLRELEVDVEWGCRLTGLLQHGDRVECRVHRS